MYRKLVSLALFVAFFVSLASSGCIIRAHGREHGNDHEHHDREHDNH